MEIRVVGFQKYKRMSLVQFLSDGKDSFNYISGPSALKNNKIMVKEVSEAGSVNDLLVYNTSEDYVFFMDGDILTGAKQNRVLNTSVLLAPNSKVNLPVSCVERGRWSSSSFNFSSSDYIAPQKLRADKARRVKESRESLRMAQSNQSEVWNDVHEYSKLYQVSSRTANLNDIYEDKKEDFDSFIKNFPLNEDANGLAVFFDNRLLFTDLFNSGEIYKEYFPKLLKSGSMDFVYLKEKKNELTEPEAVFKTLSAYDTILKVNGSFHKGVGVGTEKRFENNEITGLILEFNNNLIHLTALNIEGTSR